MDSAYNRASPSYCFPHILLRERSVCTIICGLVVYPLTPMSRRTNVGKNTLSKDGSLKEAIEPRTLHMSINLTFTYLPQYSDQRGKNYAGAVRESSLKRALVKTIKYFNITVRKTHLHNSISKELQRTEKCFLHWFQSTQSILYELTFPAVTVLSVSMSFSFVSMSGVCST